MLLDLIKSHAALHQYQRQKVQRSNVDVVIATEEDFDCANQIYQALNSVSGGQSTKLTKSESLLIESIRKAGRGEYTMKELQDLTN
jgi:flagellar basal body P-ring protein FlgI